MNTAEENKETGTAAGALPGGQASVGSADSVGTASPNFSKVQIEHSEQVKKTIDKTIGGKIMHAIIYYGLGWIGNSSLSMGITYYLNPKPITKRVKDSIVHGICRMRGIQEHEISNLESKIQAFGGMRKSERAAAGENFFTPKERRGKDILLNVRSGMEIGFMMIAGFVVLGFMAPLSKYQDKLAHKINKLLGKDTDVLPEEMKLQDPTSAEEKIQAEFKKRVNTKASFLDMVLTRIPTLAGILLGDQILNRWNISRESRNKESLYTAGWRTGLTIERNIPQQGWLRNRMNSMVSFWKKRDSSIDDMKKHMMEHYERLEASALKHNANHPKGALNETSLVMADQARILGKEWGWTLILAKMIETFTDKWRSWRVGREQKQALVDMRASGIIPQGYNTRVKEDGTLEITHTDVSPEATFEKSHAASIRKSEPPRKRGFSEMAQRVEGQELVMGA